MNFFKLKKLHCKTFSFNFCKFFNYKKGYAPCWQSSARSVLWRACALCTGQQNAHLTCLGISRVDQPNPARVGQPQHFQGNTWDWSNAPAKHFDWPLEPEKHFDWSLEPEKHLIGHLSQWGAFDWSLEPVKHLIGQASQRGALWLVLLGTSGAFY